MNKLAKHKKDSTKIREERKMDPRSKKNYGNIWKALKSKEVPRRTRASQSKVAGRIG